MQKTIQIESLPSPARRELMDFYEFLLQKYPAPLKSAVLVNTSLIATTFPPYTLKTAQNT